jgi:hypothetical protein
MAVLSMYFKLLEWKQYYVWKLNQTVLELDFWAVNFLFFPRRDLRISIVEIVFKYAHNMQKKNSCKEYQNI